MSRTIRIPVIILVLAALSLLIPAAQAQAPSKVGVFDSQRVSEETGEGKKLQSMLGALRDEKQSEINSKEQAIEDLQQRLSQQGLSLSVETRMSLEVDIQRRILEVNTLKELATQQLQLEVAAAEASFNEKLRTVVTQFGRDEGFTLLLEASTVAWAANSADVTTAIIDIFDKLYAVEAE